MSLDLLGAVQASRSANPMLFAVHRVRALRKETADVITFELARGPESPAAFRPGQFNMLYVFGVGEVPISISGDPQQKECFVHTVRAVGTVTGAMQKLKRGDAVGLRGPFGTAWPIQAAQGKDVIVVAGGIGLAPLRPALYELVAQREKFGKVIVLYGSRSTEDILYRKDLERWRSRLDMEVLLTVDKTSGNWKGSVGVVTTLIGRTDFNAAKAMAFLCGPEVMMRFTLQALLGRGVAPENIFLSMERNMKCGVGLCGHCQYGPHFVCKDGPVFCYTRVRDIFGKKEI